MNDAPVERAPRPIARLQLRKVPAAMARGRAPVFHVFEELYARAVEELAPPASGYAEQG